MTQHNAARKSSGPQVLLLIGTSLLILVLGFVVVWQFTALSQARRNTERLQAQLGETQRKLTALEQQFSESRNAQAELETAFERLESQRQSDIELDRADIERMIGNVRAAAKSAHGDLEKHGAEGSGVPVEEVRGLVDRVVAQQVKSMQRLFVSMGHRLESPEESVQVASSRLPMTPGRPEEGVDFEDRSPATSIESSLLPVPEWASPEEVAVVDPAPVDAGSSIRRFGEAGSRRRGYLFISPSQPRRVEAARVDDSESVPLPPR